MDYTDDITEMLRSDIFEAQNTALALELRERLHRWATAHQPDQEGVRLRILHTLTDALLPATSAGTLDYGATARSLIHGALYTGLDLATLKFRLDDMLA